jgi:hypothetical protein
MAALSAAAPFAGDQLDQLDRLLGEAGSERLQWLSGDVAGFRAATAGNGKGGQGHDDPFPTGYDVAVCSIRRAMHLRNDMSERPMRHYSRAGYFLGARHPSECRFAGSIPNMERSEPCAPQGSAFRVPLALTRAS